MQVGVGEAVQHEVRGVEEQDEAPEEQEVHRPGEAPRQAVLAEDVDHHVRMRCGTSPRASIDGQPEDGQPPVERVAEVRQTDGHNDQICRQPQQSLFSSGDYIGELIGSGSLSGPLLSTASTPTTRAVRPSS